jgi:hypothetical protein
MAQARRVEETDPNFEGFHADLDGFVGNNHNDGAWKEAYERTLPGNFVEGDENAVDKFTANVLQKYATEGVTA